MDCKLYDVVLSEKVLLVVVIVVLAFSGYVLGYINGRRTLATIGG